jgi:hypothetical protein
METYSFNLVRHGWQSTGPRATSSMLKKNNFWERKILFQINILMNNCDWIASGMLIYLCICENGIYVRVLQHT